LSRNDGPACLLAVSPRGPNESDNYILFPVSRKIGPRSSFSASPRDRLTIFYFFGSAKAIQLRLNVDSISIWHPHPSFRSHHVLWHRCWSWLRCPLHHPDPLRPPHSISIHPKSPSTTAIDLSQRTTSSRRKTQILWTLGGLI
jgi:hypothetical protein